MEKQMIAIPQDLCEELLAYLSKQPYKDVSNLINRIASEGFLGALKRKEETNGTIDISRQEEYQSSTKE